MSLGQILRGAAIWAALIAALVGLGAWLMDRDALDPDGAIRYRHVRPWVHDRDMASDPARLEEAFMQLAFADAKDGGPSGLSRFERPLAVHVGGGRNKGLDAVLRRVMDETADLTGLSWRLVDDPKEANVTVDFVGRRELHRAFARRHGEADPGPDRDGLIVGLARRDRTSRGDIVSANLAIDTRVLPSESLRRERDIGVTLRHEVMHGLGFGGHPHSSVPSILARNRPWGLGGFTVTDKILIRALYDPRIPVGADVKLARVLARNIIAELVEELRAGGDPDRILAHPNSPKRQ
jgi:hypothetical protein